MFRVNKVILHGIGHYSNRVEKITTKTSTQNKEEFLSCIIVGIGQ